MKVNYKKADFWSEKAREEGYPARSVYKLCELDKKFSLLPKSGGGGAKFRILDLGASPGSWSLYILRNVKNVFLCSADIKPLSREFDGGLFDGGNEEKFCFVQGDFTQQENKARIAFGAPYNLIISDAAPSTSGNRNLDALRSAELADSVFEFASSMLVCGGKLVIKTFQGSGTEELLKKIRASFGELKTFKPLCCRPNSFETYIVAKKKGTNKY
jgi:23S rRNA (uridine2552-2'-O)-methyltransferase